MSHYDRRIGGFLSARTIVVSAAMLFGIWILIYPATIAQAALAGWIIGAAIWLRLISRDLLRNVEVSREHQPRVFEGGEASVTLRVSLSNEPRASGSSSAPSLRGAGPLQLLEVRDQVMASLRVHQFHLIPVLHPAWEVRLHYSRQVDRHRGLYLLGPVTLRAADPLGVFYETAERDCLTRLTVYPRAELVPDYRVPGPWPLPGASVDRLARVGAGEEILSVREYRRGDPPARVHWRTSARRGVLHVIQLDRPVQSELAVMLDFTRRARFGLGAEATTERAIHAACAVLTRAYEVRHRFSLSIAREQPEIMPAGAGLAHLHLLLDRLAVVAPGGETDFWDMAGARAGGLAPGSRAVFIVTAHETPLAQAEHLVARLAMLGVASDFVLLDERRLIPIHPDQQYDVRESRPEFEVLCAALRRAGARVFPLNRDHESLRPVLGSPPTRAAELDLAKPKSVPHARPPRFPERIAARPSRSRKGSR